MGTWLGYYNHLKCWMTFEIKNHKNSLTKKIPPCNLRVVGAVSFRRIVLSEIRKVRCICGVAGPCLRYFNSWTKYYSDPFRPV